MAARRPRFVCVMCAATSNVYTSRCASCGECFTIKPLAEALARGVALSFAATGAERAVRLSTGFEPFDRLLGGGIIEGNLVLVSGPEGSGKTTLTVQAAGHVARRRNVIVASWEQTTRQELGELFLALGIADRQRLVPMFPPTLDVFLREIEKRRPALAVADSIPEIAAASKMTEPDVVQALHRHAHQYKTSIFGIVHLNAENKVAGPRRTVFRGDGTVHCDKIGGARRVLWTSKLRGARDDVRVEVEITDRGFVARKAPRPVAPRSLGPGCALALVRGADGQLLTAEVQTLMVSETPTVPRRVTASGIAADRVRVLADLLTRAGVTIGDVTAQVYGPPVADPGALSAAALASLFSSASGKPLAEGTAYAGEVALDGSLRPHDVTDEDARALGLRLVGKPGRSLLGALRGGHLRAV